MLDRDPTESVWRQTRFETFEQRLVLSAQPLAELVVDQMESSQVQPSYGEVAPALADVNQASGVDYAHDSFGFTGKNQTVAVIDTGVAYDHTNLGGGFGAGHRVRGGWDFAENDANPYDDGPSGFHGSHVAGILGSDNSYHTGVAPEADIVALRVFDDAGNGDMAWVEQALQWVMENRIAHNITTVNLSLGTTWNSDSIPSFAQLEDEFQSLENAGVFISVAAGNAFQDFNAPGLSYPAASQYVVPVASHDSNGMLSDFSQRNDRVLVAPGENISSTIPSHLYGLSGPSSYFMEVSGTSMAAPYVAGASMLLREAMSFVGHENISQDSIYDHFRDTADIVYDSVTGANYHRMNLERALDTLLADEYGSTSGSATAIGSLADGGSFSGTIGRIDDVDFMSFTASESGTMTLDASVTHDMIAGWQLVGGGAIIDGNTMTFDVQAGQSYTISLGSSGGIGHYDVSVAVESASAPVATNWGTIDFAQHHGESISSARTYQFAASRDGIMTVESFFSNAAGNVNLELYDANNQLVASSNSATDNERIDLNASAGDTFTLRVTGSNADVDFRLTNLVTQTGNSIHVSGTTGDDTLTFTAGAQHGLTVNGVSYVFGGGGAAKSFQFDGQGGTDQMTVNGTSNREIAIVSPGAVEFAGRGFSVGANSVESIQVNGGGGGDWARMIDSTGNDNLVIHPNSATMWGNGFTNRVAGFDRIYAYAQNGGSDLATAYDSTGDDHFEARPDSSTMRGEGYYNYLRGFDSVFAYASAGNDKASLHDSFAGDTLFSRDGYSSISGAGFQNVAQNFDRVHFYANRGGLDNVDLGGPTTGNEYHVATAGNLSSRVVQQSVPIQRNNSFHHELETNSESALIELQQHGLTIDQQDRLVEEVLGVLDDELDADANHLEMAGEERSGEELKALDAVFGDV